MVMIFSPQKTNKQHFFLISRVRVLKCSYSVMIAALGWTRGQDGEPQGQMTTQSGRRKLFREQIFRWAWIAAQSWALRSQV